MSIVGYKQLMKSIFDVDKTNIETHLEKLSELKMTPLRYKALKALSNIEKETISRILRKIRENNTGGTFKTVSNFFNSLKEAGILETEKAGSRAYWRFNDDALDLKRYLQQK
jgi:Fe2+ or Zn2+ uptake regulation protein